MLNGKTLNFKSPSKSEIKPQRRFGAMQRPKVNITIKGIHESIQNTVPKPQSNKLMNKANFVYQQQTSSSPEKYILQ